MDFHLVQVDFTMSQDINNINLNNKTDDLLEYYQHYRNIKFYDILFVLFTFIVIGTAVKVIQSIFDLHLSSYLRILLVMIFFTPFTLYYYYSKAILKAILKADIYTYLHYISNRTKRLFYSKFFRGYCMVIILGIISFALKKPSTNTLHFNIMSLMSISCFPISEEIFFRGLLYKYLERYSRILSGIIVTFLFYMVHLNTASYWHVVLSICCLIAYDKEKTIIAPISIHIINNILASIFSPTNF
jgi:membrane protease YdiL (CAAX protease family)